MSERIERGAAACVRRPLACTIASIAHTHRQERARLVFRAAAASGGAAAAHKLHACAHAQLNLLRLARERFQLAHGETKRLQQHKPSITVRLVSHLPSRTSPSNDSYDGQAAAVSRSSSACYKLHGHDMVAASPFLTFVFHLFALANSSFLLSSLWSRAR